MSQKLVVLAWLEEFAWYDWVLSAAGGAAALLCLFAVGAKFLSGSFFRSRRLYTDILEYLRWKSGKPSVQTYFDELEIDLGPVDFTAAAWRDTLLRRLQQASEGVKRLSPAEADLINRLIADRLCDVVRKTFDVANADQRGSLVDAVKDAVATFDGVGP